MLSLVVAPPSTKVSRLEGVFMILAAHKVARAASTSEDAPLLTVYLRVPVFSCHPSHSSPDAVLPCHDFHCIGVINSLGVLPQIAPSILDGG